ncbi:hypothetical protein [Pleionea litopenaei]|uniref:Uncharacterized protein n=1 Tax=Pleionea litopenaei TaxID=3070815 RepID=A0AA51X9C5_9GAMM|nr:hypothetical protein [Pleionea sp. HL-JVS1]WMS89035.1 hypothetical protein Q9312_08995 [Pleionea sp. HL-JVS1]
MKNVLIILGAILFIFGAVDLVGSFMEFDLWGQYVGVNLPDLLWKYSAYIEMLIGYLMFKAGMSSDNAEEAQAEA